MPNSFIFIENVSYFILIGDYDDNLICLGEDSLLTESVMFLLSYLVFGEISSKVIFDYSSTLLELLDNELLLLKSSSSLETKLLGLCSISIKSLSY
jgi:hypothetical protein